MNKQTEEYTFKDRAEYIAALDGIMNKKYIMSRDLGGGKKHKYYPTAILEALADMMFQSWNVTKCDFTVIVNELVATVQLTYTPSYPCAEECFCIGVASKSIQAKTGSSAENFPKGKITNALEYCAPAAKASAVGDAIGSLGNVFGRNVYRKLNQNELLPPDFSFRRKEKNKK